MSIPTSTPAKAPDLFSELDALFGTFGKSTKPAKSSAARKPATPAAPPREDYWQPTAVVLLRSSWQCACGTCGECGPQLYVRETFRRFSRLRNLHNRLQYAELPREVQIDEPTLLPVCEHCFTQEPSPQLEFPFPETLEPFRRALTKTVLELYAEAHEENQAQLARLARQDALEEAAEEASLLSPTTDTESNSHDYE